MSRLQHKRGLRANVPSSGMLAGELFFSTDRGTAHLATGAATKIPIVPPIDELAVLAVVNGAADYIIMHDADEGAALKEKKILFNDFKTALAIPAGSSDEKTAVAAGGTPGYLWGTDGTNGVLRVDASLGMTKDAGNAFITLALGNVDLGTF